MSSPKYTMNNYFTHETELAVIKYFNSDDNEYKSKLYQEEIFYPLFKLTENLINKLKTYYISDNFAEIQQMAIEKILKELSRKKVDNNKGKAYSYITKITWNFLIQENNKAYKKKVKHKNISDGIKEYDVKEKITDHSKLEFYDFFVDYLDKHCDVLFFDIEELKIAEAFVIIMKKVHDFHDINKKKIYLYIREMLDLNDNVLMTKVRKKIKKLFKHLFNLYISEDFDLKINYLPNINIMEDEI